MRSKTYVEYRRTLTFAAGLLLWFFTLSNAAPRLLAQTQPPSVKPPPVPGGVIPLPEGPPPTGQQAPLPNPALPIPSGDKPLTSSPTQQELARLLHNRSLTLEEAVAIGLATNRSLATAISALLLAQGKTEEAKAALNPTFGVGANIIEYNQPTTVAFGPENITIQNEFNPILTASANLPLDIAGTLRTAVKQSEFQEVAARIDVNRVRNQIVLDIKNAFYNVLRGQAQLNVAQDSLNNALHRLDDAQKNYAVGTVARFDVIRAQTDVANAQQNLIQARSALKVDFALLKNNMGIDIGATFKVNSAGAVENPPGVAPPTPLGAPPPPNANGNGATPVIPKQEPIKPLPPNVAPNVSSLAPTDVDEPLTLGPEYDAVVQEALRTRPEILEADAQIAAAKRGITLARRSLLPTVSLGVGYTYTPNTTGFTPANEFAATLNLNLPLLDGGLAKARVKEAHANVGTAETSRRDAVDQVTLEVQQAYLALLQARDRVAVANVGLVQALESARLARVRYAAGVSQQQGVSPLLEVSDAENSLTQAESNQVNALYDYNNARAQLDRAVGRYSYTPRSPGYTAPPSSKTTGTQK